FPDRMSESSKYRRVAHRQCDNLNDDETYSWSWAQAAGCYSRSSRSAAIFASPPAGGDQATSTTSYPAFRRLSANSWTPTLMNTGFSLSSVSNFLSHMPSPYAPPGAAAAGRAARKRAASRQKVAARALLEKTSTPSSF